MDIVNVIQIVTITRTELTVKQVNYKLKGAQKKTITKRTINTCIRIVRELVVVWVVGKDMTGESVVILQPWCCAKQAFAIVVFWLRKDESCDEKSSELAFQRVC